MKRVIAVAALAIASTQAMAVDLNVPPGYETGNAYRNMAPIGQSAYITGILDGYFASPQFAQKDLQTVKNLDRCTDGMNIGQLRAIVDQYMTEHPAYWAKAMNWIVLAALLNACQQIGKPLG